MSRHSPSEHRWAYVTSRCKTIVQDLMRKMHFPNVSVLSKPARLIAVALSKENIPIFLRTATQLKCVK